MKQLLITAFLLAQCAGIGRIGSAQETERPAVPPSSTRAEEVAGGGSAQANLETVRELKPDTFILPDKDGKLRSVLGFQYEDFIDAYQIKHGLGQIEAKPRFSLQRIHLSGTVHAGRAELDVEITTLLRSNQWVGIPVGLGQAVLSRPLAPDDSDHAFLHYDEATRTYVLWLKKDVAERCTVTFGMFVPIEQAGDEAVLRFNLPRAVTSTLKLDVSGQVVARVGEGASLTTDTTDAGDSQLDVSGVSGQFELAWRKVGSPAPQSSPLLQATASILLRVDGPAASPTALLKVESLGPAIDAFRVLLPAGTSLVTSRGAGYVVQSVKSVLPGPTAKMPRQLVEVRLDERTTDPVEVRLETERTANMIEAGVPLNVAGFDVLGALRQSGDIAIQVKGNWNVLWATPKSTQLRAQQVEVAELADALREQGPQYGFKYFRQPCQLAAQIVARQSRVRVNPEYIISVGPHRADLDGHLDFMVGGTKAFAFEVAMADWEIDDIGPPDVVEQWLPIDKDRWSIRLREPPTGPVSLDIQAHLEFDDAADESSGRRVSWSFPQPREASAAPATVVIVPDDNVLLLPIAEETVGLSSQGAGPTRSRLPKREQEPLYFRLDVPDATFHTNLSVQQRTIRSDVSARVSFGAQEAVVDQSIQYHVAYEPVEQLSFKIPTALANVESLTVELDGEVLKVLHDQFDEESGTERQPVRVALRSPKIGMFTMQLHFPIKLDGFPQQQQVFTVVPLVAPAEGETKVDKVMVVAAPAMRVGLDEKRATTETMWTVVDDVRDPRTSEQRLQIRPRSDSQIIPLVVERSKVDTVGSTLVKRAWIQSWLSDTSRLDRMMMMFETSARQATLQLPGPVAKDRLELIVDGAPVAIQWRPDNVVQFLLPDDQSTAHRLELRYELPLEEAPVRQAITFAQLLGTVNVRNVDWQLVLPKHVHLLKSPSGLTAQYDWNWNGLYWSRRSTIDPGRLVALFDADPSSMTTAGTNQYFFHKPGWPEPLELQTAHRSTIVLGASSLALVASLLLLYLPVPKKPVVVLALVLAAVLLAIAFPEPALLYGQAAALGVALALFAVLLRRVLRPRAVPSVVVREAGSTVMRPLAVGDVLLTSEDLGPPSTATTTVTAGPPVQPVSESSQR